MIVAIAGDGVEIDDSVDDGVQCWGVFGEAFGKFAHHPAFESGVVGEDRSFGPAGADHFFSEESRWIRSGDVEECGVNEISILAEPVKAELKRDLLEWAGAFPDRHGEADGFEIEKVCGKILKQ